MQLSLLLYVEPDGGVSPVPKFDDLTQSPAMTHADEDDLNCAKLARSCSAIRTNRISVDSISQRDRTTKSPVGFSGAAKGHVGPEAPMKGPTAS